MDAATKSEVESEGPSAFPLSTQPFTVKTLWLDFFPAYTYMQMFGFFFL